MRRFTWPAEDIEYTTTERVRESVPEDASDFDSVERLSDQLHAIRGAGFEHSWRAAGDIPVSPSWLTLRSAAIDEVSGRVVGVGHLTHEAFGLSHAHDLGAMDGRNAFSFTEAGHGGGLWMPPNALYIGSSRTGAIAPLDADWNFISADLHGATGLIATIDFLGSGTGCVALYGETGERQLLTVVPDVSGAESIRFSPDGRWLLIGGGPTSRLVEAATGRSLQLEVGNAGWWPPEDSALLTIEHSDGAAIPRVFSLATNGFVRDFPAIQLDVPLLSSYPYIWNPEVSPDGTEILAATPAGVTVEYQQARGVGSHVARVALSTGAGRLIEPVFFDGAQELERDATSFRWTTRPASGTTDFGPELSAALQPATESHEHLVPGRWAEEAQHILVLTLNRAISLTQDGQRMAQLMPEILAAIRAIAPAPDVWAAQREWLTGLLSPLRNVIASGELSGADAVAWDRFMAAVLAVEAGRPELINPVVAVWAAREAGEPETAEMVAGVEEDSAKLAGQPSQEELFALVQSWLDAPELVSYGSVSPQEFCASVDQLLHLVPQPELLDQIQDFANRTSLATWASSDLSRGLGDLPWGQVADGLQKLRSKRGWPDLSN